VEWVRLTHIGQISAIRAWVKKQPSTCPGRFIGFSVSLSAPYSQKE